MSATTMPSLEMFSDILLELSGKNRIDSSRLLNSRNRLKFVNHSTETYDEIEQGLCEYLRINISDHDFASVYRRIEPLNDECRICELLLELIAHAESTMDRHVKLFDDVLSVVNKVKEIHTEDPNFKENAIDKCALLIYDSFSVLRSMRKKVMEVAKIYHVPYFYDIEDSSIRLRSSLLTTYKNLCVVMDDYSVLNEALWYVRHFNYFSAIESPDTSGSISTQAAPSDRRDGQ